ncbi:MAG: SdiA-regulated domain-containing protein, partial [Ginsengibacter sp.]
IHKKDFEELAKDKISFNPSAIAIHPITHEIYLLSTKDNKCMAVYNRDGKLISFQSIDSDLMPQPEGICFSPDGKLYISSEGKKGDPGNLFEFNTN